LIQIKTLKVLICRILAYFDTFSVAVCEYHLPIADAFSFEIIKKLREKYLAIDAAEKDPIITQMRVLAKAS
jgi:hypothetical protein